MNLIEALYLKIKEDNNQNLKMNELCIADYYDSKNLILKTKFKPININSILIISRKNQIFFTPDSISEIVDNGILMNDKRLKNKDEVFVTYKY